MNHILCLHSSQSSGAQWRALQQQLSAELTNAQILTPNLIGYGKNVYGPPYPAIEDFRLADEVAALTSLLDNIFVDPVALKASRPQPLHLVGHSYGGAIALRMARLLTAAGTPPASLSLYEPVAFHVLAEQTPAHSEIQSISEKMATLTTAEAAATFVDYWNFPGYFAALPDKVQQGMIAKQTKVQADFSALMQEPATLDDYANLNCSVLLLYGSESPQSSREVARLLAETLPDVQTATIEGGHMAPLTDSEQVNPHITNFLRQHTVT